MQTATEEDDMVRWHVPTLMASLAAGGLLMCTPGPVAGRQLRPPASLPTAIAGTPGAGNLPPQEVSGLFLTGVVLHPSGKPAAGAKVFVQGRPEAVAETQEDGNFRLGVPKESATYRLVAYRKELGSTLGGIVEGVTVKPEATDLDVGIVPTRTAGAISGKIIDVNDGAARGVKAKIPGTPFEIAVDSQGAFLLDGIPDGIWDLVFHGEKFLDSGIRAVSVAANRYAYVPPQRLVSNEYLGVMNLSRSDVPNRKATFSIWTLPGAATLELASDAAFTLPLEGAQGSYPASVKEFPITFPNAADQTLYYRFVDGAGTASPPLSVHVLLADADGDGVTDTQDCAPNDGALKFTYTSLFVDGDGDGRRTVREGTLCGGETMPSEIHPDDGGLPFDCADDDAGRFDLLTLVRDQNSDGVADDDFATASCTGGHAPAKFMPAPDGMANGRDAKLESFQKTHTQSSQVVVYSIYEASDAQKLGHISIQVPVFDVPTTLVLSAYHSVQWSVSADDGVARTGPELNLVKILTNGYYAQSLGAIPASVATEATPDDLGSGCYEWPDFPTPWEILGGECSTGSFLEAVRSHLGGAPVRAFFGAYSGPNLLVRFE